MVACSRVQKERGFYAKALLEERLMRLAPTPGP